MDTITVTREHYEELITKASRYDALMLELRPALEEYEAARKSIRDACFSLGSFGDIEQKSKVLANTEVRVLSIAAIGAGVGL
jgi:hypothetical protein